MLNLTQHPATPAQIEAGVVEPASAIKAKIVKLLNFEGILTPAEIAGRAAKLAAIAAESGAKTAMIGGALCLMGAGALYLMGALENALRERGVHHLYAFSIRESVEAVQPDGSVVKTTVLKHGGFASLNLIEHASLMDKANLPW